MEQTVLVNHLTGPLYYEQTGHGGPPMLFVPPIPLDHSSWLFQVAHFSTWFHTVAVDLPGFGRSPAALPGLTIADLARACWETLDTVTSGPAILVGQSVGSHVVLEMADQQPARTSAVVLSGTGSMPIEPARARRERRILDYQTVGMAVRLAHVLEDFSPAFGASPLGQYVAHLFVERNSLADVNSIVHLFNALIAMDQAAVIDRLTRPTLILSGSLDSAHRGVAALLGRLHDGELVTIDGAGHACNVEQPEAFDRHLVAFLRRRGLL